MRKVSSYLQKKSVIGVMSVSLLSFLFATVGVYGATTISTNMNTGGTLTVTGQSTLTGAIYASSTAQVNSTFTTYAGAVFNEDAAATGDFRVEGATNANTFMVDASADRVGIGTSTPSAFFSVGEAGGTLTGDVYLTGGLTVGATTTINSTEGTILLASSRQSDPTGVEGLFYYSAAQKNVRLYNGSSWGVIGTSTGFDLSGRNIRLSDINNQFITLGTTTAHDAALMTLEATSTLTVPLTIVAQASQSANLFQIKNNAATNLFAINSAGRISTAIYATSTLQATGDALFYGTLGIATTTSVSGRALAIHGNALISGDITSVSNVTATGTLTVAGNVFATSNIFATGTIQATGNILGYGTLNSGTSSPVAGRNSLTGNLLVSGDITSVSNVTATGTLTVAGNVFATSHVYATGTVQATGNILGYGTLNSGTSSPVAGRNSLTGNLLVSGDITSVANVTATGTLNVTGLTTLVGATTTRVSISENLMVGGFATTTGADGNISTLGTLTVTGNVFATSNVYATGTVQATGNILGYGTLNSGTSSPVAGRNSLTGNLLVSGDITSVANVTATGTLNVTGLTTLVGATTTRVSISENLMVGGFATTTGSSGQFATQGKIGAGGTSTPATELAASGAATTTLYLHSTGVAGGCIQLESSTSTVYRIYIGEDTGGSTELVVEVGTCK